MILVYAIFVPIYTVMFFCCYSAYKYFYFRGSRWRARISLVFCVVFGLVLLGVGFLVNGLLFMQFGLVGAGLLLALVGATTVFDAEVRQGRDPEYYRKREQMRR